MQTIRAGGGRIRGPEWDRARANGIGGSEAAAAMGISPWKTRLQLYLEKTGQIEPEDISAVDFVYFGTMMEPIVLLEYQRRTNLKVVRPRSVYRCRDFPFMLANVDGRVSGIASRVIIEAKTVGMFAFIAKDWGADGSAIVPIEYYAQAQHNSYVAKAEQCDIPVLIGGQQFRIYRIPRDREFQARMLTLEQDFWRCVEKRIEPPPADAADLLLKFPKGEPGKVVEANVTAARAYQRWLKADSRMKFHGETKEKAEFVMKNFMGDAEEMEFNGERIATWRMSGKSRRFCGERPKKEKE